MMQDFQRRRTYFLFQGLLMAVLLLLFSYHAQADSAWVRRFWLLLTLLTASLLFIRLAPERVLVRWWVQMGLFAGDAALTSLTLHWSRSASDLYLIYLLILFGTALARNLRYSLFVAAATSALYLLSGWNPAQGLPTSPEFWLRFLFLWVSACLLAILSQDASQAQREQERLYRDRLVQAESLAALGQAAGEVAHRIKGPLTTIMVNAEVLTHRFGKSEAALRELGQIRDQADRCKDILKNLLDLGRIEEMDFVEIDLRDCVRSAVRTLEPQLRKRELRLKQSGLGAPLKCRGDASMLQEAVLALLQNALEASRKGGTLFLCATTARQRRWWLTSPEKRGYHAISVRDEGEGIPRHNLENIFKPFFTTKGAEGSGLGLSAALRISQKHGGFIEAHSDGTGAGATFVLNIPAHGRRR